MTVRGKRRKCVWWNISQWSILHVPLGGWDQNVPNIHNSSDLIWRNVFLAKMLAWDKIFPWPRWPRYPETNLFAVEQLSTLVYKWLWEKKLDGTVAFVLSIYCPLYRESWWKLSAEERPLGHFSLQVSVKWNSQQRLKTEGKRGALMARNQWRQCGGVAAGCQLDMWVHQLAEWLRERKWAKTHLTLLWWDTDEVLFSFSWIWINNNIIVKLALQTIQQPIQLFPIFSFSCN